MREICGSSSFSGIRSFVAFASSSSSVGLGGFERKKEVLPPEPESDED